MHTFTSEKHVFAILRKSFEKNEKIPFLPQIVLEVERAIGKRDTGARELSAIILDDPTLSAKILKLANSIHYNHSSIKVKTITQAIIILGFEVIRSAIINFSIIQLVTDLQGATHFRACWKHSLATGLLARNISGNSLMNDMSEEVFVAGLLHDIGRLILGQIFAPHYDLVEAYIKEQGLHRIKAEELIFKTNHVRTGMQLAKTWSFPSDLISIIEWHEYDPLEKDFEERFDKKSQCIIVANTITSLMYEMESPIHTARLKRLKNRVTELFNISTIRLEQILKMLPGEVENSSRVLDLIIDDDAHLGEAEELGERVNRRRSIPLTEEEVTAEMSSQLELLKRSSEAAREHASLQRFFEDTARQFARAFHCNSFYLIFFSKSNNCLKARLGYGTNASVVQEKLTINPQAQDHLIAQCYNSGVPIAVTVDNIDYYTRVSEQSVFNILRTTNIAVTPIDLKTKIAGVLLACRDPKSLNFHKEDLRLLACYSDSVSKVLLKGIG